MSDMNGGPSVPGGPVGGPAEADRPDEPRATQTAVITPPPPQPPVGTVTASAPRPIPEGARRGGITAGVILIALGALMLVGRYAPWGFILRLWPLIIIIGGVIQILRPHGDAVIKRVAEGVGTVVVGGVLLGNSLGAIPWSVWFNMISLWPLLIVALGIELVGRGLKLDWVRALSNVLLTLALLYGAFVMGPGWHGGLFSLVPFSGETVAFDQTAPHDPTAKTGSATFNVGATRLTVGAGDALASIKGDSAQGAAPELSHSVIDGVVEVSVQDPSSGVVIVPQPERSLAVKLDRTVAWEGVVLDMGAADADVDLRELSVSSVYANVGASALRLRVGDKSDKVAIEVSGGATSVTIYVPANAAVDVESQSGLSAVSVPSDYKHVSGIAVFGDSRWTKAGSGGPQITISLKSGVSSLEILTD